MEYRVTFYALVLYVLMCIYTYNTGWNKGWAAHERILIEANQVVK